MLPRGAHLLPDDDLPCGFDAVRHTLGGDPPVPLDETEYDGLALYIRPRHVYR